MPIKTVILLGNFLFAMINLINLSTMFLFNVFKVFYYFKKAF